jgi:hypothetical protein
MKTCASETELDRATTEPRARYHQRASGRRGASGLDIRGKGRSHSTSGVIAVLTAAATMLAASGCGSGDSKTYDISPIFPLSSDKCAKYDGRTEGTGIAARCWVTKAKCEQAASDWRRAMQSGGISDAIEFSCS